MLIVFDLDGTLAESKSALDAEMATLLGRLLRTIEVAIISGGDWPQFEAQVLSRLADDTRLSNLSLLPTCGTKFYTHAGIWKTLYSEEFSAPQKKIIIDALQEAPETAGIELEQHWGDVIEDRGSQIIFSALGQAAPLAEKKNWDPDFAKRKKIKLVLDVLLPEYSVKLGGSTSIDVTRPGIDKGYGIKKLQDALEVGLKEMLFIGDALYPGGNDYPAKEAGVDCIQVRDPNETKRVIEAIIAFL